METNSTCTLGYIIFENSSGRLITNSESSDDSRGFCTTIVPELIAPPSPTSMAEYIENVTTPSRAAVSISSDGGVAVFAALSEMWDDGEVVLRAMRVTAPEKNSMDMVVIIRFFLDFVVFTETLSQNWDQEARKSVVEAAEDFKSALKEARDGSYAAVTRAVDRGYAFRNVCLENICAHSDSMDETISTLNSSEYHAKCLMMLARGQSGGKMSKHKFFYNALTVNWIGKLGALCSALSQSGPSLRGQGGTFYQQTYRRRDPH